MKKGQIIVQDTIGNKFNKVKPPMEGDAVLREIETLAKEAFLPIIGPKKGKYLVDTIKRSHVKNVLEVGTLIGYSAILMAKTLPQDGRIVTIEINASSAKLAEENIRKAGLADKVEIHTGNAITVIPSINGSFDMIFLDASKGEYFDYLRLSEEKLKTGGVVFADNVKVFGHEMRDYLDYVRNSGRYKSEYIDVGFDGVEISTKLF
ncbi:MAG: O-methyltransferase [Chloroflexota bacterium]